jgi:hypothetical protein
MSEEAADHWVTAVHFHLGCSREYHRNPFPDPNLFVRTPQRMFPAMGYRARHATSRCFSLKLTGRRWIAADRS